jgi:ribosomal protein S18 acetylase RimI-like enzyme
MIRPLTSADVDQFIQIRRESFLRAPLAFVQNSDMAIDREDTIQELNAKSEEDFILGYFIHSDQDSSDNEPHLLVGILGLLRYMPEKRQHRSFMWGVYVKDEMQGRGIARQLINECILRARAIDGLERIVLTTSHHSETAINLYRSEGFIEFGREPGAAKTDGVNMDEVHMLLDLR